MKAAFFGLVLVFACMPVMANPPVGWEKSLQESLVAEYPLTKVGRIGLYNDYQRITQPGCVLVVQIPGIYADISDTTQAILKTTIQNGQALQQKGFAAALTNKSFARELKPNEHVFVLNIAVKENGIQFELLTADVDADPVNGSHRYRSEVFFPFERGSLSSLKVEDIKKVIDSAIASPEVANAVQSKIIRLGMTFDEVKKILGSPSKIVDLGTKQTYVYPDMKIVFKDGIVADVQ